MRRIAIGCGAVGLCVLTLLFVRAQSVDFDLYERTVDQVSTLTSLHEQLSEGVVRSRHGLLPSYDPLVETLKQSTQLVEALRARCYAGDDPAVGAAIVELGRYLGEEELLLQDFQSPNSILSNSITYISSVSRQSQASTSGTSGDPAEVRAATGDLVRELLLFDGRGGSPERVSAAMRQLSQLRPKLAGNSASRVDAVLQHGQIIMRFRARADAAAARLTDGTGARMCGALHRRLLSDHEQRVRASGRYRGVLYALSMILVVVVSRLFLRLGRGARSLRAVNGRLQSSLEQLRGTQGQLMEASRKSGMAEVATAVLHNVGNVLNSINASAEIIATKVSQSNGSRLSRVVDMLPADDGGLARFFVDDARGKKLPAYLRALAAAADHERAGLIEELARVKRNVEHVKTIVRRQQSVAKYAGAPEPLSLGELVEDAISIAVQPHAAGALQLSREYTELPPVTIDRHRALQIVVNLIKNACDAVRERPAGMRRITVRVAPAGAEAFALEVEDNGVGISAENLNRIFQHGFSTKSDGHGFGLHHSAVGATDLGGRLIVHSDGEGRGARFRLELPLIAQERYSAAS